MALAGHPAHAEYAGRNYYIERPRLALDLSYRMETDEVEGPYLTTKNSTQILRERFDIEAKFDETNRSLFAFAPYNAGPGRIAQMHKEAEKRGLDSNKWFNNVELVTAEKVGIETTTYVRNIYKYYAAYKLMLDVQQEQKKAREQVVPGKQMSRVAMLPILTFMLTLRLSC